jgi:hypothetical protein
MENVWLAAAALCAMLVLSIAAAALLPRAARVPMQWGPGGKPTWTAPTWAAVMFTPFVAMLVFVLMLFSVGDDRAMWVLLPSLAMLFLVFHAGHLFFAIRHFTRRRN